MNRYKNLISRIVNKQEKMLNESKIGTSFNEGYTSYDAYVERVEAAYSKIYKRLKYLCPIKKFESSKGIPVIYTGYVTTLYEMYPQKVCICEWQDESLPKIVIITETFGSPETILKRAYGQEPISVKYYGKVDDVYDEETKSWKPRQNSFQVNPEIAKYKLDDTDIKNLEAQGCKFSHKGGTSVEVYWIKYVAKIDEQNKEKRKQEWLKQQDENYVPEVKSIDDENWTIKTGFKFAKRSDDTLSHYRTIWQDTSGELYGFNQEDYMHKLWCPSYLELWSDNPEKLKIENVKEGVEKAVNNVIQNSSWFDFCWLGRYHNIKKWEWEKTISDPSEIYYFSDKCKYYYDTELSKKLPLKLVKWEKI